MHELLRLLMLLHLLADTCPLPPSLEIPSQRFAVLPTGHKPHSCNTSPIHAHPCRVHAMFTVCYMPSIPMHDMPYTCPTCAPASRADECSTMWLCWNSLFRDRRCCRRCRRSRYRRCLACGGARAHQEHGSVAHKLVCSVQSCWTWVGLKRMLACTHMHDAAACSTRCSVQKQHYSQDETTWTKASAIYRARQSSIMLC